MKGPEPLAMEILRNERRKEKILATGLLISVTANIVMAVVIFFLKKH